jgi:hypothetical protein
MDTADQLLERVASGITRETGQVASKEGTLGRRPGINADSLQVQEASSQLLGGHGQEAR